MGKQDEADEAYINNLKEQMLEKVGIPRSNLLIRVNIGVEESTADPADYELALAIKEDILEQFKVRDTALIGTKHPREKGLNVGVYPYMSDKHATLRLTTQGLEIADMRSKNGTFVIKTGQLDGAKITEPELIYKDDYPVVIRVPAKGNGPIEYFSIEISKVQEKMRGVDVGAESKASPRHNGRCEDTVLSNDALGIYGVFDGISAAPKDGKSVALNNGDVASLEAANTIRKFFNNIDEPQSSDQAEGALYNALVDANADVYRLSTTQERLNNMSTTAAIVYVAPANVEGTRGFAIASIGDSRTYHYTEGKLIQLNPDQNYLWAYGRAKGWQNEDIIWLQREVTNATSEKDLQIIANSTRMRSLNEPINEDDLIGRWDKSGFSAIYATIGIDTPPKPLTKSRVAKPGDMLVVVSDGIIGCRDNLTEPEFLQVLESLKSRPAQEIASNLVRAADAVAHSDSAKAKLDDMSAVVIKF